MKYLEVQVVKAVGTHCGALTAGQRPLVRTGQRLVAVYGANGVFAVDITEPYAYEIILRECRGGTRDPVELYWVPRNLIEACAR